MHYLLDTSGALDHPVTRYTLATAAVLLALTPVALVVLARAGRLSAQTRADVKAHHWTWLWLAPAILGPIVVCPGAAMLAVMAVSILCYREYARATGLFRERAISAAVVLGIVAVTLTALDNWYALFVALNPLVVVVIASLAVVRDSPRGYVQRVALGAVGFLLFGSGLGHLGFVANDPNYRAVLCMLIACAQLSDIAAYVCGKAFGGRALLPNTSPARTLGGQLGALVLITPLAAWLGHLAAPGTALDEPVRLLGLGLIVAVGAQLGGLVLDSIKRDLGITEIAGTLPGHGGFLDRFNSLLLVAPAAFHYMNFFAGLGAGRTVRAFTGQQ